MGTPPDPPLDVAFLAAWTNRNYWKRSHKDGRHRLEYRMGQRLLELLTERQVEEDLVQQEKKWQGKVKK